MIPVTQSWIAADAAGQPCRVYKAGAQYFTDALPLRLCDPGDFDFPEPRDPAAIVELVAEYFGLTAAELCGLCGLCKKTKYVYPRQVCCYLLRGDLALSWPRIAALMGKDKKTIRYSYTCINEKQHLLKHVQTDLCNLRAQFQSPASLPS